MPSALVLCTLQDFNFFLHGDVISKIPLFAISNNRRFLDAVVAGLRLAAAESGDEIAEQVSGRCIGYLRCILYQDALKAGALK